MRRTILTIVTGAIFFIMTVIDVRAENVCKDAHGRDVTCIEKLIDNDGNPSCGKNCSYRIVEENGTQVLHIYKPDSSKSATIRTGAFSPDFYAGNQVLDAQGNTLPLQNIMLDNDFENIGMYAFSDSGAQISSVNGQFVFDQYAYYMVKGKSKDTTLNGDVIFISDKNDYTLEGAYINGDVVFADGVAKIGIYSVAAARINGNVVIPESVKNIERNSIYNVAGQIYCEAGAEKCYDMLKKGCGEDGGCLTRVNNLFYDGKFSSYPDGCDKLGFKAVCEKCKGKNFKLENGICWRIRYTPAEVAEIVGESNTIYLFYK